MAVAAVTAQTPMPRAAAVEVAAGLVPLEVIRQAPQAQMAATLR
tara:strand:- start:1551 stop:1682 length:132 start_codon:yes stop_codon:yes gene_type:complete